MSGTAGFCLLTGCVILNRCMCLPRPIWPRHIPPPAICPVLYLSRRNSRVCARVTPFVGLCRCVCTRTRRLAVSFQVKLVLYNHGCVSSPPSRRCARIPDSDIDPCTLLYSEHTHIHTLPTQGLFRMCVQIGVFPSWHVLPQRRID